MKRVNFVLLQFFYIYVIRIYRDITYDILQRRNIVAPGAATHVHYFHTRNFSFVLLVC